MQRDFWCQRRLAPVAWAVLFGLFGGAGSAHASEHATDPASVVVDGVARRSVPIDALRVVFGLTNEARSFGEARAAAAEVFARIRSEVDSLGLPPAEYRHEFASLEQDRVSFGNRGSNIGHQFTIEIAGLSPGAVQDAVAGIIDLGLGVNRDLVVVQILAYLSEARERALHAELLEEASADALSEARRVATPAGARVVAPLSLESAFGEWRRDSNGLPIEEITVTSRKRSGGLVSVSTPFALGSAIRTETRLQVRVRARFQIAPLPEMASSRERR